MLWRTWLSATILLQSIPILYKDSFSDCKHTTTHIVVDNAVSLTTQAGRLGSHPQKEAHTVSLFGCHGEEIPTQKPVIQTGILLGKRNEENATLFLFFKATIVESISFALGLLCEKNS